MGRIFIPVNRRVRYFFEKLFLSLVFPNQFNFKEIIQTVQADSFPCAQHSFLKKKEVAKVQVNSESKQANCI